MGIIENSQRRLILQPRDHLLLKRLCDFGYLTLAQIQSNFFDANKKVVQRRLKKLSNAQLIHMIRKRDGLGTFVFIPNANALQGVLDEVEVERGYKAMIHQPWFRSICDHEDTVRNIALVLLAANPKIEIEVDYLLSDGDWGTDFSHGPDRRKVPDFVLRHHSEPIGVFEVELTTKSKDRYLKIFTGLLSLDQRTGPL